jgi:hypothetical protein
MTCGNEGPEKNTGRAARQGHMARRNGTVYLSASISSSSHYQLTIGRLHNNHAFLIWQIACLFLSEPIWRQRKLDSLLYDCRCAYTLNSDLAHRAPPKSLQASANLN